jgi:glucose-6-phosphatase
MMPLITQQVYLLLKTDKGSLQRKVIHISLWFVFFVVIAMVSLSRIFIATHFPHQVIGGVLGGIAISNITQNNLDLSKFKSVMKCSSVSLMLVVSSLGFYEVLSYAIFDPSESVQKAQKWCANPAYIHIETRPFYALVRDAGSVFGIGLAHWLVNLCKSNTSVNPQHDSKKVSTSSQNNSTLFSILEITFSLTVIQLLETFQLSFSNEILSYVFGYFKNVALVIIVVFITPTTVSIVKVGSKTKSKRN